MKNSLDNYHKEDFSWSRNITEPLDDINDNGKWDVGREPIEVEPNEINQKYLLTKRDKLGHLILDHND